MRIKVSVRKASLGDVPAIVDLNDRLFGEDAARWDPFVNLQWAFEYGEIYFDSALSDDRYVCFLAESPDTPAGYLIGSLLEPYSIRPVRVAELESMFVVEAFRGQGVGTRLVQSFREWAVKNKADRLRVTAYAPNARAVAFYRRIGFEPWKLTFEMGAGQVV